MYASFNNIFFRKSTYWEQKGNFTEALTQSDKSSEGLIMNVFNSSQTVEFIKHKTYNIQHKTYSIKYTT